MDNSFTRNEKLALAFFGVLIFISYLFDLNGNDVWTMVESYYVEAVREMWERNNFIEVYYNYELRFNKPIMTYWLVLASSAVFGISEFAARLPIALAGLGAIALTYGIGNMLDGKRYGVIAAMVMAFSLQFLINTRSAVPAVPLTFFFTLTMYFFVKAYHQNKPNYYYLSYIALGLTILTKGFPYLIVIGGIIIIFIFINSKYKFGPFFKKILGLKMHIGIPIAALIGMSWLAYMYFLHKEAVTEVVAFETVERAFTREDGGFKPFFYLEANSWGFLPYSLAFYIGLIYLFANRFRDFDRSVSLQLGFAWFITMLIIFTTARGKIPTYFIQCHPGMSLFTAYFVVELFDKTKWRNVFKGSYWLTGVVLSVGGVLLLTQFPSNPFLYALPVIPWAALALGYWKNISLLKVNSLPFSTLAITYILFLMVVVPFMENGYRNHDLIGNAILEQVPDKEIPLLAEDYFTWNLPYYAQRRTIEEYPKEQILEYSKNYDVLALVRKENLEFYGNPKIIWEGLVYTGSETQVFNFVSDMVKQSKGEKTKFKDFCVIYIPKRG
ncbi:MAG: glycosyltransferase family 39 protein [Bacteroidota bacterium]